MEIKDIERLVDNYSLPKKAIHLKKRYNHTFKVAGALFIVSLFAVSAVATYLTYFGKFDARIEVTQAIKIDGYNYDHQFLGYNGDLEGGCCEVVGPHTITNDGCVGVWLQFQTTEITDPQAPGLVPEGVTIKAVECNGEEPPEPPVTNYCYLDSVEVTALDGMAQWDSYDVYVDNTLVGTYTAVDDGGVENWVKTTFDLSSYDIPSAGTHTVKIDCKNGPWTYFNPYGQLGITTISLYRWCDTCAESQLCETVDVATDTTHNLQGWGPVEPATHGGTWGGIGACRATWFYEDPQNDASWATVDFSCPECQQPVKPTNGVIDDGCDCADPDIGVFYLDAGESIDFCLTYGADILVGPGNYIFQTILVPVPAPSV